MKKRYIIIAVCIIVTIISSYLFNNNIEQMLLRMQIVNLYWCQSYEELKLGVISIDEEEKEISISFEFKDGFEEHSDEVIKCIYEEIYDRIYGDNDNKYCMYKIDLCFEYVGENFNIINITYDKSQISIINNIYDNLFSIYDIAIICPEVSELRVYELKYEKIEEISSFNNLKSVYCYNDIIDIDEKIYIQSLFPKCELDWQGKED